MSQVRIRWNYPTKRTSGGELPADAIQGADWGTHGTVAYPAKELLTADLPVGAHTFTGVCVLKNGKRSAPASVTITIADDSTPEILLDLSAVVEA
jgi:hypothetical protein